MSNIANHSSIGKVDLLSLTLKTGQAYFSNVLSVLFNAKPIILKSRF